jgi:hypothetical protein
MLLYVAYAIPQTSARARPTRAAENAGVQWRRARGVVHVSSLPAKKSKSKNTTARVAAEPETRVRKLALALPDVEQGTTFGYPAFKVNGKTFAWFPKKKGVEDGSLGVRMSFLERDHRIAANPQVFYFTAHYKDYTSVLARVWLMKDGELKELLASGHEFVLGETKRAKRKR